jgi:hypothetical protein
MLNKTLSDKLDVMVAQVKLWRKDDLDAEQIKKIFLTGIALLHDRQLNIKEFWSLSDFLFQILVNANITDGQLFNYILEVTDSKVSEMGLYNQKINYLLSRLFHYLDENKVIVEEVEKEKIWHLVLDKNSAEQEKTRTN